MNIPVHSTLMEKIAKKCAIVETEPIVIISQASASARRVGRVRNVGLRVGQGGGVWAARKPVGVPQLPLVAPMMASVDARLATPACIARSSVRSDTLVIIAWSLAIVQRIPVTGCVIL